MFLVHPKTGCPWCHARLVYPFFPHAPGAPHPDLATFLTSFLGHFGRREHRQALRHYVTGVLTQHPHKNCDTLAAVLPMTSEQHLQGFLTDMVWHAEALP